MARFALTASLLLMTALAMAGCSGDDDDDGPTSTSPTSTTTVSASTSPAIATAVEITRAPTSMPAGSFPTVCWSVSGTGHVGHVAIHWDDVSHAAEPGRTFADYNLGASYPNNQSTASPSGYDLQPAGARFCTAAEMPAAGSIFVVGHVIDSTGAPGRLSTEREIKVGPASDATLTIQNFAYMPNPLRVAPSATVTVMNQDAQTHTATGAGGSFDSGDVAGQSTGSFTAPTMPGSYTFGCAYHPTMSGVLEVVPA